jgi:hypothetical protein
MAARGVVMKPEVMRQFLDGVSQRILLRGESRGFSKNTPPNLRRYGNVVPFLNGPVVLNHENPTSG